MNNKKDFAFCGLNRIVWKKDTAPAPEEIMIIVDKFLNSHQYHYLEFIASYYHGLNHELSKSVEHRKIRNKTPNWFVPSAYYSTVVDTMAGFLFNNVVYAADGESGKGFAEELNAILKRINIDVTDMHTGTRALAFNRGCELVYTYGDGETDPNIDVVSVDPRQMVFVYNNKIEPEIMFAILITASTGENEKYHLDVVSKDNWSSYIIYKNDKGDSTIRVDVDGINKTLYWSECPAIEYNTDMMSSNSPFNQILPYIAALDALLTGNSNELDKLAEALLVMSKTIGKEDKANMSEWKLIDGLDKDDLVQYVERQITPEFRNYMSTWLVNEIHKHSHVIDFYSPDISSSGDASGKALRTRLVDMKSYSQKLEKTIQVGFNKRIRLFKEFINKVNKKSFSDDENVKIIFNRTQIVGAEDIAPLLVPVDFMSKKTKQELSGLSPEDEEERMENEKEEGVDVTDSLEPMKTKTEPEEVEPDELE